MEAGPTNQTGQNAREISKTSVWRILVVVTATVAGRWREPPSSRKSLLSKQLYFLSLGTIENMQFFSLKTLDIYWIEQLTPINPPDLRYRFFSRKK